MKAAVLEELNAPLVVEELEIPELQFGQVLVKVEYAGVCGAQLAEISGAKGEDLYLPHLLGHEGGGVVEKIGLGVTEVKQSDHVVMHWRPGAGVKGPAARFKANDNGKLVGSGPIATFGDLMVVSENRLTPIAKDIPLWVAALFGCSMTTALGLINNEAKLRIGESIAISGCGGVGINVVQGARMVSAYPIIAIDIHPHKLELARKMGATHAINAFLESPGEEIRKIVGARGVDVFVDCVGVNGTIGQGYSVTAPGGRMILVGQPRFDHDITFKGMRQHYCGKTLLDSQGGLTKPEIDIPRYMNLYRNGNLNLDGIITHFYKLERINDAIDDLRRGAAVKCMLDLR